MSTTPRSLVYVLDTSAIIAYLFGERPALKLQDILSQSGVPFMALTEAYYLLLRRMSREQADQVLTTLLNWPVTFLYPDQKICLLAADLKGLQHLGIADSFIVAFALEHSATLVSKDPDYKVLEPRLKFIKL